MVPSFRCSSARTALRSTVLYASQVFFVGICLSIFTAPLCQAEIHKYRDNSGTEHFVDSPEKIPEQYRHQSTTSLREISRGGSAQFPPSPAYQSETGSTRGARLKIYVTQWCGVCRALERFLEERGIRHTRLDIERDGAAMREFRANGARGVPMIKIGSKVLFGFNERTLLEELGEG